MKSADWMHCRSLVLQRAIIFYSVKYGRVYTAKTQGQCDQRKRKTAFIKVKLHLNVFRMLPSKVRSVLLSGLL